MKENKNIRSINNLGELHGYQEWYWLDSNLYLRCVTNKARIVGYYECHKASYETQLQTIFYI